MRKECPMERVACVNCQQSDERLRCIKGYLKTYPNGLKHPGRKKDLRSRW